MRYGTRQRVLDHLTALADENTRRTGPITYPELGAALGLSPTMVGFAVTSLVELQRIDRVARRHPGGSVYRVRDEVRS